MAKRPSETVLKATDPIQDLWDKLHADGYLNSSNTLLDLPAQNSLGSAQITALLNDPNLFPDGQIKMSVSGVKPPAPGGNIVLDGTISGKSFNFDTPSGCAVFSIDGSGNTQLAVTTNCKANTTALGTAFPGLSATGAAANMVFETSSFAATSSDTGNKVTFRGAPLPDDWYAGIWKTNPTEMTGNITSWPTSGEDAPGFDLLSPLVEAVPLAGLLPLSAGLKLTSTKTDGDKGVGTGSFKTGLDSQPEIDLGFDLVYQGVPPAFASGKLDIPLLSLGEIANILMGSAADACVPNRFPLGNNFKLSNITFELTYKANKTMSASATISVDTSIELLPLGLASLEGVDFTFTFSIDLSGNVIINGLFKINNNEDLLFNGGLAFDVLNGGAAPGADSVMLYASNAKDIDVLTLLNIVPGIPELPKSGIVAKTLQTTVVPALGTYTFKGAIEIPDGKWSVEFGRGIKLIELDGLELDFVRTSTDVTVKITANTVFLDIPINISAQTSRQSKSWIFTGMMSQSEPVHLRDIAGQLLPFPTNALPDVTLDRLYCTFDTSVNTFTVSTALSWEMDILPVSINADLLIQSNRAKSTDVATYSGHLTGVVDINNMILTVSYIFSPTTTDITFAYRNLKVVYHKDNVDPYVAVSLENSNVGDLFTFLMSFAQPGRSISLSSPWDALEKISLPNLTVKVHLKTKKIEVNMDLDIDLGFISIQGFTLSYVRQYGKPKFNLELTCEFLGQKYGGEGNKPLSWDPLNEQPPVVPGAGTQVFDLEYLGIGQRMSIRGDIPPTMEGVIKSLEKSLVPVGNPTQNPANQLPGLAYDAGSNWMIGTRFRAMSTIDLSVVFNDPRVYGLLIQLSGSRAGVFAGLRFEIMYRKISDDVGVYHIELTLPDEMRHLEFGEVSITLPVVTIDIYTNGNFRIDAGFPPTLTDFSRSFSVQVFPFIGYGGFYFGVLNGETSSSVPQISNGNFSPVIELGLALQVGVGKTLSLGILSGGISITVGGMLQGTLSWFNPSDQALVPEMFFHVRGTLAVIGQVYATVDFGIIQASVSLTVYVSASVDVESYREILLSVSAGVNVRVSIKIVFVRIHFSFHATITESFTIGSNRTTPWQISGPSNDNDVQRSLYRSRNRVIRQRPYSALRSRPIRRLSKRGLLKRYATLKSGPTVNVDVTAIPLFSQASSSDFDFNGAPTPPKEGANAVLALVLGLETSTDVNSGTNKLLTFLSDWVTDAINHHHDTLSAAVVDEVLDALQLPDVPSTLFSYEDLVQLFESNNVSFRLKARPDTKPADGEDISMAIMAMIPELSLDTPNFDINYKADRIPSAGYEDRIEKYFEDLSAQFAERNGWTRAIEAEQPDSMATLIFRYYFLMLARGLMQQTKTFLAEASWPLNKDTAHLYSLSSLANQLNNNYTVRSGENLTDIAGYFGLTETELQAANPQVSASDPDKGQTLFIPSIDVVYKSKEGDTLAWLSACFGLDQDAIKAANPGVDFDPLPSGTSVSIPSMRVLHTALKAETGTSIANDFGIDLAALAVANPDISFNPLAPGTTLLIPLVVSDYVIAESNQNKPGKLAENLVLQLGDIPFLSASVDTFSALASQFGMQDQEFVSVNQEVRGLFASGQKIILGDIEYTTGEADTFNSIMGYWFAGNDAVSDKDLLDANPDMMLSASQTLLIPQITSNDIEYPVTKAEKISDILAAHALTIDELVESNATIGLERSQKLNLKSVSAVASNSFILPYRIQDATETLEKIAKTLFDPADTAQQAAVQSLRQWNGNISPTAPIAVGTTISVPYFTTVGNILRQFGFSLEKLCSETDILTQKGLFTGNVPLLATGVQHTVQKDDTLSVIAQNYDLSLEGLTSRIALVQGIFSPDAGSIAIKAVPGMRRDLLASSMIASGEYSNALNMTTRFMLNGLRLPDPNFVGVKHLRDDPDTAYPLYALTGQEYPLEPPKADYSLTIKGSGASWISVDSDGLKIDLLPEEIQRISDFTTLRIDSSKIDSHATALFTYVPDRQTVSSTNVWATEDVPDGMTVEGQRVNKPRIWRMPDALITAVAESPDRLLPYLGKFGTTLPDGNIAASALQAARYATIIDVSLQLPPGGPAGSYLLGGTDQTSLQRTLSLWTYLQSNPEVGAKIYLAYPAQSVHSTSEALATDQIDRLKSFLIKTNLSTESHGELSRALRALPMEMMNTGLIDSPVANLTPENSRDFLQLVWECSIVKNGGYYLNYAQSDGTPGLPNTLFGDGSQASIQMIVMLDDQPSNDCIVQSFNNAMVVGDNIDLSAHGIFFEAVTHSVKSGETLDSIASGAPGNLGLSGISLGQVNQLVMGTMRPGAMVAGQKVSRSDSFNSISMRADLPLDTVLGEIVAKTDILEPGAELQLAGKPMEAVKEGSTLSSISAEYDFLDPASLVSLNSHNKTLLAQGARMILPEGSYTIAENDTFASIAEAKHVDLSLLGDLNADTDILSSGSNIVIAANTLKLSAALPPGHAGFTISRDNPEADGATETPQDALNTLFNLAGFQLKSNSDFKASNEGLPAGPTNDDDEAVWNYRQIMSITAFAKSNNTIRNAHLPDADNNPYVAVGAGSRADIAIDLQDIFGNRTDGSALPDAISDTGYTDELVGLGSWPSVNTAYKFVEQENSDANLVVSAALAGGQFLPDATALQLITGLPDSETTTPAAVRAEQARLQYRKASYQLQQPDITARLSTTLGSITNATALAGAIRYDLLAMANSAYIFLGIAKNIAPTIVDLGPDKVVNFETLLAPGEGYPVDPANLGKINTNARADLLFGLDTKLVVPFNTLTKEGDSPQAVLARLNDEISLETLGQNNKTVSVGQDVVFKTAERTTAVTEKGMSLNAIALQTGCPVASAPGDVAGIAQSNASAPLGKEKTLIYTANGKTYGFDTGTDGTASLKDAAEKFARDIGTPVSVDDVAMANLYLDDIYSVGQPLAVAAIVAHSGDTIESLATTFGASDGEGDPVTRFITSNAVVPNFWPLGTALFVENRDLTIKEGQTLGDLAQLNSATVGAVIRSNPDCPFKQGSTLAMPFSSAMNGIDAATLIIAADTALETIATKFDGATSSSILDINATIPALFSGEPIEAKGKTVTPDLETTPLMIATQLGLDIEGLANAISADGSKLRAGSAWLTPAFESRSGETLQTIANRYNVALSDFVSVNGIVSGFISSGQAVLVEGKTYSTYANDTLSLLLARINADLGLENIQNLSIAEFSALVADLKVEARKVVAPVSGINIAAEVTPFNRQTILDLGVNLSVSRDPSYAAFGFENAPRVISTSAAITAAPFAAQTERDKQSLDQFAVNFETAFPGLKLATGPKLTQGTAFLKQASMKMAVSNTTNSAKNKNLWVVNFAPENNGVSYSTRQQNARYFGLPPLATVAWNGQAMHPKYSSDTGLTWDKATAEIRGGDPEKWNREFLAALDLVLSPSYAVPATADAKTNMHIQSIIAAKAQIAAGLSKTVQPIVKGQGTGLGEAIDAMEQQMLIELSNAYSVQSLVQVDVDVAGASFSEPATAPQLSGQISPNVIQTPADKENYPTGGNDDPLGALALQTQVSRQYLAGICADIRNIVRAGLNVSAGSDTKQRTTTVASDTLRTLSARLDVPIAELAGTMTVIGSMTPFFLGSTAINVTPTAAPDDLNTVTEISHWSNVEISDVLTANMERTDFFKEGSEIVVGDEKAEQKDDMTLLAIATKFGGISSFAAKLGTVDAGSVPGSYILSDAPVRGLQLVPQLSFSTSKAPLIGNNQSRMTAAFSVKDPSVQKSVTLDLDYHVNQLEFDRHGIQNVHGYQDSSWLSFVIPIKNTLNTSGRIGQLQIPVPLRGYPQPATISRQVANRPPASNDPVKTLAQWDYGFDAARRFAAQDQMTMEIMFNHPQGELDSPLVGDSRYEAIIALLASFSTVWGEIAPDLALLPETTGSTVSQPAKSAVSALADFATKIGAAWETLDFQMLNAVLPERGYLYEMSILTRGIPAFVSSISFERSDQSLDFSKAPDDFIFTCSDDYGKELNKRKIPDGLAKAFEGYGFVLGDGCAVLLKSDDPQNADWIIVAPEAKQKFEEGTETVAPQTFRIEKNISANELKVSRQILWPAIQVPDKSNNNKLLWVPGRQMGTTIVFDLPDDDFPLAGILNLPMSFYRLNVMGLQDGWGGSSISRNANLLAGSTINPDFVYTTPLSMFPTRISPLISETAAIEMQGGTLSEAVANVFKTLTAGQAAIMGQSKRNMRVQASYWAGADPEINPADTPLRKRNPLVLSPLYAFDVTTDFESGNYTDQLVATMEQQARLQGLSPAAPGKWVVDILIYSYNPDDDDNVIGDQDPNRKDKPLSALLDIRNQMYDA
ncbi:LysM peptidoglycan-binding domain-containing protein [Thalassospira sp. MA62]|nr:LysM peptidoglycan-binding domain-containing protein [Thalassospira sp. MA62]